MATETRGSIRISQSLADAIKDEQTRLWIEQRIKISQSDLLEKAWFVAAMVEATDPPAAPVIAPIPYRVEHQRWHDILERVLEDDDEKLGIMKNLEWAEAAINAKGPTKKRANGG